MNAPQHLERPQPVKLTIDDFLLLDRSGALAGYHKTELIDGVIVAVNAQFRRHAYAKQILARRLWEALEAADSPLFAWMETAVAMPPHSMPEPDISLSIEGRGDGALTLAHVALAIEVADSTVGWDLGKKAALYAVQDVPEYWVVDLPKQVLHQLWEPIDGAYAQRRMIALGKPVSSVTIGALTIATDHLL